MSEGMFLRSSGMKRTEKLRIMFEECVLRFSAKRGLTKENSRDIVSGFFDFLIEVDKRDDQSLWDYSLRLVEKVGIIDAELHKDLR